MASADTMKASRFPQYDTRMPVMGLRPEAERPVLTMVVGSSLRSSGDRLRMTDAMPPYTSIVVAPKASPAVKTGASVVCEIPSRRLPGMVPWPSIVEIEKARENHGLADASREAPTKQAMQKSRTRAVFMGASLRRSSLHSSVPSGFVNQIDFLFPSRYYTHCMILFLYGADTFRSRQYLRQSVEQFRKTRDPQGYNVVFLDGKKDAAGKILTEIVSMPFLAERRMIVIDNILSNSDKELLRALISRIADNKIPQSNVVIFWQGETISKVKEAKELSELLKKEKYAQEFAVLTGAQLSGWVEKELQSRGGSIDRPALEFLCSNAGRDMWRLNSLIDQLVAYADKRQIALADCQKFLDEKIDDNIFNLVDAIVQKNSKAAFTLLAEQRRQGEEDGKILGLLAWQFRILVEMADLLERTGNATSDILAKELGIHPFVAKKNMNVVRSHSLSELEKMYQSLLAIDYKTKTGKAPQSLLLDLFVNRK